MPRRYVNMSGKVSENMWIQFDLDFAISTDPNKTIVIRKVRLINPYGQLDIGCCLCGDFADDSSYSLGLMDDFIMCTNELNQKEIHIHNTNKRRINYCFRDYKGNLLTADDDYYYTLELKIIY